MISRRLGCAPAMHACCITGEGANIQQHHSAGLSKQKQLQQSPS